MPGIDISQPAVNPDAGTNQWHNTSQSWVGEIRAYGPDSDRLRWTVGGFGFYEDQGAFLGQINEPVGGFGGGELNMPSTIGWSLAGYADATFDVVESFRVLGGLRFAKDRAFKLNASVFYFAYAGMQFQIIAAVEEDMDSGRQAERTRHARTELGLASDFHSVLCACGGPLEYQVASSPTAPGADAQIVADINEDTKQTNLTVEVKNLPPAERVEESSQHYVAWYRKDSDAVWTRMAALAYEPDSREARMSGSVPELELELEITHGALGADSAG